MCAHLAGAWRIPKGVRIVEIYNGGSRDDEDAVAAAMADEFGYIGIGGSDSHIVSHIGRCATEFPEPVTTEAELVAALKSEQFRAITTR